MKSLRGITICYNNSEDQIRGHFGQVFLILRQLFDMTINNDKDDKKNTLCRIFWVQQTFATTQITEPKAICQMHFALNRIENPESEIRSRLISDLQTRDDPI